MDKKTKYYKPYHTIYKKIGEDIWGKYASYAQNKKYRKKLKLFLETISNREDPILVKQPSIQQQHILTKTETGSELLTSTKHIIDKKQLKNLAGQDKLHLFRIDIKSPKPKKVVKSPYRKILEEKRKVKAVYGNISEKNLRQIYELSIQKSGNPMQNFFGLLESRIDMILFRANLTNTIAEARQLISHGLISINGNRIFRSNYRADVQDLITIKNPIYLKLQKKLLERLRKNQILCNIPNYIEVNYETGNIVYLYQPLIEEIPYAIKLQPQMVPLFFR